MLTTDLDELDRQRDTLLEAVRELEWRLKDAQIKPKERTRSSKFSDVLNGEYKLFVSPTHSMCDECGVALYQHMIRPFQRNLSWGDVNLCPKCLAKARSGEPLKCYESLFPSRDSIRTD